jgi:hypothetical protein
MQTTGRSEDPAGYTCRHGLMERPDHSTTLRSHQATTTRELAPALAPALGPGLVAQVCSVLRGSLSLRD